MSAIRPHVMLVERLPGEDGSLDACVARVRDSVVLIVRFANLWQALTEVRYRQRELGFAALGLLDLVGHGEPGALSVGDALLSGDVEMQRVLAQVLNPPALVDEATVLRLLGCGVGVGGLVRDVPLGAEGDGPMLALALKRRLGCRVQVTLRGVDPHDFTPTGFATAESLAESPDFERCGLVPVESL